MTVDPFSSDTALLKVRPAVVGDAIAAGLTDLGGRPNLMLVDPSGSWPLADLLALEVTGKGGVLVDLPKTMPPGDVGSETVDLIEGLARARGQVEPGSPEMSPSETIAARLNEAVAQTAHWAASRGAFCVIHVGPAGAFSRGTTGERPQPSALGDLVRAVIAAQKAGLGVQLAVSGGDSTRPILYEATTSLDLASFRRADIRGLTQAETASYIRAALEPGRTVDEEGIDALWRWSGGSIIDLRVICGHIALDYGSAPLAQAMEMALAAGWYGPLPIPISDAEIALCLGNPAVLVSIEPGRVVAVAERLARASVSNALDAEGGGDVHVLAAVEAARRLAMGGVLGNRLVEEHADAVAAMRNVVLDLCPGAGSLAQSLRQANDDLRHYLDALHALRGMEPSPEECLSRARHALAGELQTSDLTDDDAGAVCRGLILASVGATAEGTDDPGAVAERAVDFLDKVIWEALRREPPSDVLIEAVGSATDLAQELYWVPKDAQLSQAVGWLPQVTVGRVRAAKELLSLMRKYPGAAVLARDALQRRGNRAARGIAGTGDSHVEAVTAGMLILLVTDPNLVTPSRITAELVRAAERIWSAETLSASRFRAFTDATIRLDRLHPLIPERESPLLDQARSVLIDVLATLHAVQSAGPHWRAARSLAESAMENPETLADIPTELWSALALRAALRLRLNRAPSEDTLVATAGLMEAMARRTWASPDPSVDQVEAIVQGSRALLVTAALGPQSRRDLTRQVAAPLFDRLPGLNRLGSLGPECGRLRAVATPHLRALMGLTKTPVPLPGSASDCLDILRGAVLHAGLPLTGDTAEVSPYHVTELATALSTSGIDLSPHREEIDGVVDLLNYLTPLMPAAHQPIAVRAVAVLRWRFGDLGPGDEGDATAKRPGRPPLLPRGWDGTSFRPGGDAGDGPPHPEGPTPPDTSGPLGQPSTFYTERGALHGRERDPKRPAPPAPPHLPARGFGMAM